MRKGEGCYDVTNFLALLRFASLRFALLLVLRLEFSWRRWRVCAESRGDMHGVAFGSLIRDGWYE
jgi:hypothetical protein